MADHMYKLSEVPKKKRLAHFWEYYKIPVIFTIVISVIVLSMIYSIFFSPKPDTYVLFASSNVVTLESLEKLESELYEKAFDYNGDKKNIIELNTNIVDSSNEIDIQHYAAANQKLIATLAMDSYIIQIVDETMFNFLKEEQLIGTYKDFTGYNTGMPEDKDVKIPLSSLAQFDESPSLLGGEFYLTIRDRYSAHIEGSEKKTQAYDNHIDMLAKILGFEKIA